MKIQYLFLALLIHSCGEVAKENKPQSSAQENEVILDSVATRAAAIIDNNVTLTFEEIISLAQAKTLPHTETTNFDSFTEDNTDGIDVKALKLDKVYKDFDKHQEYYKPIAIYKLPLHTNFHTFVVTVQHGEHEMETVLINFDTDGNIIDHQLVAYDEIAESMARTVSRISENKLTVNQIFWANDKEVQEIEFEITYDGSINHVNTKKLNDAFENFALIDGVLTDLKLDWVQTNTHLISSAPHPDNPKETILVIPEIVDEGEMYFDLNAHIVIADNRSGKIKNNYFESNETNNWESDAIELDGLQIDPTAYQITEDKSAFGVTVSHIGHSRVNPYSDKTLSLFVKSGDSLLKVLSDYTMKDYGGEWDGDCDGEFTETKKSLSIGQEKTNGYFDIRVDTENSYTHSYKDKNGDCLSDMKLDPQKTILKFNGWRYSEYELDANMYSEFQPEEVEKIQIDNVHITEMYQMGLFKIMIGLYVPKNGELVSPDTEDDNGYRLFILNEDNEIRYKSQGFGDLYHFEPLFYKSDTSDKTIIICQKGFEYPFGGEVFIYQDEKIEHIGTLDVEGYDPEQIGTNYLTEIIEIKEGKAGIEFSFKTDRLILNPGGEHEEVIANHNVRYVYKNNELSLLWNK
ncbi:hypothetical protein DZC72_02960 [Maribacter algicola]|uniref:Uncharacterized protein n=1 Tax=Maribacter algicola TaxID=2498892 RepID=A0A426RKN6_9FLAO|nr:hypothetical protein [Maribacter algicola]RRQ49578.1 hypothetical protein DZC72_02960 [Maribacter algicola]